MKKERIILKKPELMAPAGDWTMLTAVINNGADAVYLGIEKLNMRSKAANFKMDELEKIAAYCKPRNVKTYLTLNSIIKEEDLIYLDTIIPAAKLAGIDAIICWDQAVMLKCREYGISFCISTQASVSNSLSVDYYKMCGASRIVLARECSLDQIKKIKKTTDIEIEVFAHGAMCIAVSGRCFMSHHLFGKSANEGECIQPCRREYEILDTSIDKSMVIGTDYILSPKDLCTIEFIDKLIESGVDSFKIEGRKRSSEYAAKTVSVYRRGIDLYFEGKLTRKIKQDLLHELSEVYNRGFSPGFYHGIPSSDDYAGIYGSKASKKKEYIGKVLNYYKKNSVVFISIETGEISEEDELLIIGPTTGVLELKARDILVDGQSDYSSSGKKGEKITLQCSTLVRRNDTIYKMIKTESLI